MNIYTHCLDLIIINTLPHSLIYLLFDEVFFIKDIMLFLPNTLACPF